MTTRVAARAVIFRGDCVLLLRRASDQRIAPDAWQCPVGKQDPGEPIEATLAREVHEETGLTVQTAIPLGNYTTEVVADGEITTWRQFDFLAETDAGDVVLSDEHRDFRWVPPAELGEFPGLAPQVRVAISRGREARDARPPDDRT